MEPLKMSPLPTEVFSELSCDFLGPLPGTEQYLCVIIDDYSQFPVVEVINSTSASAVISVLDKLFSFIETIPTVIRTDNGQPFNGQDWVNFAEHMGFKHRRVTPIWPRGNGEAERFMRTVMKSVSIAHVQGKNWRHQLNIFLRDYRQTPHSSTGKPPGEILFNRPIHKWKPKVDSIWMKTRSCATRISKKRAFRYYVKVGPYLTSSTPWTTILVCFIYNYFYTISHYPFYTIA